MLGYVTVITTEDGRASMVLSGLLFALGELVVGDETWKARRRKAGLHLFLASALLFVWVAGPALAQPTHGRMLRGVEHRSLADGSDELQIRMGMPVRYLRHAPRSPSRRIDIEITPLGQELGGRATAVGDEALPAPPDAADPLEEVRYRSGRPGPGPRNSPHLELLFSRPVVVEVSEGSDLRRLVVVVVPDPRKTPTTRKDTPATPPAPRDIDLAHPFALQLFAGQVGEAFPQIAPTDLEPGLRLYRVPFERNGVAWQRLRLGFFATEEEAGTTLDALLPLFPDAWIVTTSVAERRASVSDAPGLARRIAEPEPAEHTVVPRETPAPGLDDAASVDDEQLTVLLAEGRSALAGGQQDRAVQLFTKVLSFPENASTPEALEWLGLARERKGQLAHARAEYETYLERYPEGEGAQRVRQRLDALITARAEPPTPLRPASTKDRATDFDVFGSIASGYRRDKRFTDGFGDSLADSSIYTDLFIGTRWQSEQWDVRSELSGAHLFDFIDNDERWRANTLFVEAEGRGLPWNIGLGRLPGNRAGVVGRFDGAAVSYELRPGLRLGTVAGFPVDPFMRSTPDLDQRLLGLNLETLGVIEGLDVEFFAIQQWAEGLTDRTAVGAEFRYAADGRFLAGLLDYDVHFGSLNTAFLIGNLRLSNDTDLNVLLDWRRLPTLGTRNALFGQLDDSLSDLDDRYSTGELESLAEDRTSRSRSASIGLTHRLNERFQISGDVAISDLSGTPASGGIEEFEGTGRQISTYLQITGSELFTSGDIGTFGARWIDARTVDILGLSGSWRSPMWRRFRLNPLLDLEWRSADDRDRVVTLRPGLRVDLRVGSLTFDFEGNYQWSWGERFPGVGDEEGFTVLFGARYDY
ncbi:MAG: hypothetical protein GY723_09885 [bacterium]|nr:hypothetical protein [bacterium]